MNVLWLDASAGMAGDMFVAAALDAGFVSLEELQALVSAWLPERPRLGSEVVDRSGMRARTFTVDVAPQEHRHQHEHEHDHSHGHQHAHEHDHAHPHDHEEQHAPGHSHPREHRGLRDVEALLARCPMPPGAVERARAMFGVLARAEAKVHGVPVETIHFHEVGATDSLVDFALAAYVLEKLGAPLVATPAAVGRGRIVMQHGVWPVPPPGTAEVLREGNVPVRGLPESFPWQDAELLTPTGACILRLAARFGDVPAGTLRAVGVGAGSKVIPGWPNVVRLVLVDSTAAADADAPRFDEDRVAVLETFIDDMPPNLLAEAMNDVLAAGALDYALSSVAMKKGRVGFRVEVLAPPGRAQAVAAALLGRTTTIGLRVRESVRWKLWREETRTDDGITAKLVHDADGTIARVAPETDALAARARAGGPAPMFGWRVEDRSTKG